MLEGALPNCEEIVRQTEQEIRQIEPGTDARTRSVEIERAVYEEIVHGVVLIGRKVETEFQVMPAPGPRQVVIQGISVVDFPA